MKDCQNNLFCNQCCLNFGNNFLYGLHLKLVHKKGSNNSSFLESPKPENECLKGESTVVNELRIQEERKNSIH